MSVIVVVASQHGGGKSTAVKGLLEIFPGMRRLEMGAKFRELAANQEMTVDEFSAFLNNNREEAERIDRAMDDYQRNEVEKGNIIVDSNLGAMAAPNADLKVLLLCDPAVRAARVVSGGGRYGDQSAESEGEMARQLVERDRNDRERYIGLYGFDMFDEKNYDLVMDVSEMSKNEVVQKIAEKLNRRNKDAF